MIPVAISGLGAIAPGAGNTHALQQLLETNATGVSQRLVYGLETPVAVGLIDPTPALPDRLDPRRTTRTALLAGVALEEAIADAGLQKPDLAQSALFVGTSTSGMAESETAFEKVIGRAGGRCAESYDFWRMHPAGSVADSLALGFGLHGPRLTVAAACASSAQAMALALWSIRSGQAQVALAGGADALCKLTFFGFRSLKVMDDAACRPFDRARNGMNLGEGAAFLVLEPLERVLARGKKPHALLLGAGLSCDSHHMTQPDPEAKGAASAIRAALRDADIAPERVGYVNAHGTATLQNDPMEAKALRDVLGAGEQSAWVSSTKPITGHTLGAAGALEAAITVLAIRNGSMPCTLGLQEPDPACALRHVPQGGVKASLDAALSSSFAFGGLNAVLAFGRSVS